MRLRRFAGVLACAAAPLLTGCFQSSTLVKLNPDGSGTIEQTISVATQMIEQLKTFAAMDADAKGGADQLKDLFSVEQAKKTAARMGTGVSVVSANLIATPDRTGLKAVYAFKDIRTLALTELNSPFGVDMGGKSAKPMSQSFTQLPNGHALLTIKNDEVVRDLKPPSKPGGGGGLGDDDESMKMIKAMMTGLKVDLAIQVGHVVKTNIPYVAGGTVTLLSVDFDQVLANPTAFDRMDKAETLAETKAALQGVKGIKINLDPELRIEFTKLR
jgi:hypothetical protein